MGKQEYTDDNINDLYQVIYSFICLTDNLVEDTNLSEFHRNYIKDTVDNTFKQWDVFARFREEEEF